MEIKCDILIPAAIEKSINKSNMERIDTKIIGEAGNGPTTYAADRYLTDKGVFLILKPLKVRDGDPTGVHIGIG